MITLNQNYTYEKLLELMDELVDTYPEWMQMRELGISHDMRSIRLLIVGKGKPSIICTAGVHGRESINPILLLHMAQYYGECAKERKSINQMNTAQLLEQYRILMIPIANPDGYVIATEGFGQIRNPVYRQNAKIRQINHTYWKANARGVDINRNFPCSFYHRSMSSEYPGSENETQVLMRLFQEYDSEIYLDFHSRGRIIYYYRNAMSEEYNAQAYNFAAYMQQLSKYKLGEPEDELSSVFGGGNTVQYYAESIGKPAITIETLDDFVDFPIDCRYQSDTWQELMEIPLGVIAMLE